MNTRLYSLAGILFIFWIIGIYAFNTGQTAYIFLALSSTALLLGILQGKRNIA